MAYLKPTTISRMIKARSEIEHRFLDLQAPMIDKPEFIKYIATKYFFSKKRIDDYIDYLAKKGCILSFHNLQDNSSFLRITPETIINLKALIEEDSAKFQNEHDLRISPNVPRAIKLREWIFEVIYNCPEGYPLERVYAWAFMTYGWSKQRCNDLLEAMVSFSMIRMDETHIYTIAPIKGTEMEPGDKPKPKQVKESTTTKAEA